MTRESNIHLVDDDEVVRDALDALFRSRGLALRGYANADQFLRAWRDEALADTPSCLVLDVRMPGMSGLELFEQLKAHGLAPHHAVIFLTGHGDIPMAVEALRGGAYYFFEKPHSGNQLVDRVEESLAHVRRVAENAARGSGALLETLSPREREIAQQIVEDRSNRQIAEALCISVRTVEVHRARIFAKLEVKSAVGLAQLMAN
ncbi:response regulator transcription factor [Achromobacter aloeverae]|uniref:DNA-binding response regulator n=1 Tax=Achromobacter aloeverae TaxID=1750518 RepID=A0A4Q1HHE5_9BURK|nr:response regulator [Achromobacter aloeverae]RXN85997.1 DNA-binding response regulator [Achromobacter aloeverae]